MPKTNIGDKKGDLQRIPPEPKEVLRERVLYLLLADFLITDQALVISAILLREWTLAIAAFMPLAALTVTIVAALFGQKKMMDSLCELMKDLIKWFRPRD
jgi:hypothetical protein